LEKWHVDERAFLYYCLTSEYKATIFELQKRMRFLISMNTIAFPLGTLLWTPDTLRPIETLQAGDTVIGFNPDTFSRVLVSIQRVQIQERVPGRRLQVGGRMVMVAENQSCTVFNLNGDWHTCPAVDIHEGDFLPVDRLIPVPAAPIALPHLDEEITNRLDEDRLALSDALYNSTAYFREMEKRTPAIALLRMVRGLLRFARRVWLFVWQGSRSVLAKLL
jgi:hypothetical protein